MFETSLSAMTPPSNPLACALSIGRVQGKYEVTEVTQCRERSSPRKVRAARLRGGGWGRGAGAANWREQRILPGRAEGASGGESRPGKARATKSYRSSPKATARPRAS